MPEKYFNRQEAEELLPVIRKSLKRAREQKQEIDQLDQALARAAARIMVLGGSLPPYHELARTRGERERIGTQIEQLVEKIQETGCVVKDLDEGLVDFPALLEGREVYLCWKLGEERIAFWHGLEEGFAGRKPLDQPEPQDPLGGGKVH